MPLPEDPYMRHTNLRILALMLVVAMTAGCDGGGRATTSTRRTPPTVTSRPAGTGLVVSPEFIHGTIPGANLLLLVGLADPSAGPVDVTAEATGAQVAVEPATIDGEQVAEVSVVPGPVTTETGLTIRIIGGAAMTPVEKTTTILPWEDDQRAGDADRVLGIFTPWLADNRPDLGITPRTEFSRSFVAPMLLVVSHYLYLNPDWELGVEWHIMLPPDDFAEIYLRPRDQMYPTLAFRVDSWQTALDTGTAHVYPVDPPAEVVR